MLRTVVLVVFLIALAEADVTKTVVRASKMPIPAKEMIIIASPAPTEVDTEVAVSRLLSEIERDLPRLVSAPYTRCDAQIPADRRAAINMTIHSLLLGPRPIRRGSMLEVALVGSSDTAVPAGRIETEVFVNGMSALKYRNDICTSLLGSSCPIAMHTPVLGRVTNKVPGMVQLGAYIVKSLLYLGRSQSVLACVQFEIKVEP